MPQQRHASAPDSTADATAMTGNDGSTDFDLALESNEVLAAMDDAAFTRAVTRCLASHRPNLQRAAEQLGVRPARREPRADPARRRGGGRQTPRSRDGPRGGRHRGSRRSRRPGVRTSDPNRDPDVATVVVRRWENGASSIRPRRSCNASPRPCPRSRTFRRTPATSTARTRTPTSRTRSVAGSCSATTRASSTTNSQTLTRASRTRRVVPAPIRRRGPGRRRRRHGATREAADRARREEGARRREAGQGKG